MPFYRVHQGCSVCVPKHGRPDEDRGLILNQQQHPVSLHHVPQLRPLDEARDIHLKTSPGQGQANTLTFTFNE